MWKELLIILIILWISTSGVGRSSSPSLSRHDQIAAKLTFLNHVVRTVCSELQIPISYRLYVSSETSYVKNKSEIYLVVWDYAHHRMFDDNTLIYAILHEVVHILTPCEGEGITLAHVSSAQLDVASCLLSRRSGEEHNANFLRLEDDVLRVASAFGYYDPHTGPSKSYPHL